jgi:hypothetical protein
MQSQQVQIDELPLLLMHPIAKHLLWICSCDDEGVVESVVLNIKNGERIQLIGEDWRNTKQSFISDGWIRAYVPDVNIQMDGKTITTISL